MSHIIIYGRFQATYVHSSKLQAVSKPASGKVLGSGHWEPTFSLEPDDCFEFRLVRIPKRVPLVLRHGDVVAGNEGTIPILEGGQ